MDELEKRLPLGKATSYSTDYDPSLLCPVPRRLKRDEIGLAGELPFTGFDLWNAWELSWLDERGKPVVALGLFRFDCRTPNLVESKSLKLYCNSYNQTRLASMEAARLRIERDLAAAAGGRVEVRLFPPDVSDAFQIQTLPGECIDHLDIDVDRYALDPELLAGAADVGRVVERELHSHLLKSNCLVTGQPDWASVLIRYQGPRIDEEALLRYLISFRQHNEFHEQCVERIFVDLKRFCRPQRLTVHARYTRRGGLDINPFRSDFEQDMPNLRLVRQ
ncbi:7-cyano-7-deazaguanine reductase [Geothermobacter ehrlichii]|uniref:7-cyano-7-deazaguanine reductase n=1 Tax=Geothermobacter ehrlichii TaxID=213224 RepID=A0A5D3WI64_9BACT|nr:NADPH-dependent 7-cyano-7-deazaguanine reductase QueF [Geothermobacter ehrlichii]TYO97463.1 7-cyano-7-deazaguanine reductase [Geothermobacter ehrlichii]